ncbi:MAG TPA: hypothetical protein VNW49_09935, partial [Puia sp.]|nr:hypothetical protein [Puia sp.]
LVCNYFATNYFFGKKNKYRILKISGLSISLITSLIFISSFFYDISFDGQWYHQETIIQLKNKWNPVFNKLDIPVNENTTSGTEVWCTGIDNPVYKAENTGKPAFNLKFLNINHFSKGTEIIEASIYALTNRIETGKSVNGIFLLASFFLALSFLYKIDHISNLWKWLLAILISFNPITLTQLLSFCVDGVVASSLLSLLVISCLLFQGTNKYYLWILTSIITLSCNIKYTSLVFTAIFCLGFLITLLINKKKKSFNQVLIICVFGGMTGIFICGFHPYLTNFIHDHNMFYGLKETKDEIRAITPPVYKNLNRFEKLFLSLSSHTDSYSDNKSSITGMLKIPFTVNKNELLNADDPEVKLSAFGPFYSGSLLIALLIFFIALTKFYRSTVFKQELTVLVIISSTILIMPNSWWGRNVPQFWLLPVSILFMSEFISFKYDKLLKGCLCFALGLNVIWASLAIIFNLFISIHIDYQLSQLKALHLPVTVEYCPYRRFKSNRVRFYESDIPFLEKPVTGNYIYNVIHSNTRIETTVPLPHLPKPLLLVWSEKINAP